MDKIWILICNFKKAFKATFSIYLKTRIIPYNREELFNLPVAEKYELVMDLWDHIENDRLNITKEEIKFAKERLKLHIDNPSEGISMDELKKSISEKYGF